MRGLIAVLIWVCLAAPAARADIDYRCLNLCVNAGNTGSACMAQCSYAPAKPGASGQNGGHGSNAATTTDLPNHRLLPTLTPDDGQLLTDKKQASPYMETKDYACITQCLHNGMQYEVCSKSCTTVTLKNGQLVSKASQPVPDPAAPPVTVGTLANPLK